MTLALHLADIHKSFGSTQALRGADFSLRAGELHALLGENGAGKSTLMHIAAGLLRQERGEVRIHGQLLSAAAPKEAMRLGVGMVHQHFTSVPAFTVAENVALTARWQVSPQGMRRKVNELNRRFEIDLDPDAIAGQLPLVLLQRLEILKTLATGATVLLLDEPTGSLDEVESHRLLGLMRKLVSQGSAAVLITHKLDEALRFADSLTVLRQGEVTLTGKPAEFTPGLVARAMLGADLVSPLTRPVTTPGEPIVCARDLTVDPVGGNGPGLRNASFTIRAGEIVGVASVQGNGERELLRSLAGLLGPTSGYLTIQGSSGFVPEDRTAEGVISEFTLWENLTLGMSRDAEWIRHGFIDRAQARHATNAIIRQQGIKAENSDVPAGVLSGGNQQKLIIARALLMKPALIIAENPTRGLDVRAALEAGERLVLAARDNVAVIFYSSDLDELLGLCHRLLVLHRGRIHKASVGAGRDGIGRIMLSGAAATS